MTKLLEQAVDEIRKFSPDVQDEYARNLIRSAKFRQRKWTDAQLASIDRGITDADAGRFATDDEMAALRTKFQSA